MRAHLQCTASEKHCSQSKSSHLGQNTKPAKNATTAASFAHRESGKDRKRGGGRGFASAGPSSGNSWEWQGRRPKYHICPLRSSGSYPLSLKGSTVGKFMSVCLLSAWLDMAKLFSCRVKLDGSPVSLEVSSSSLSRGSFSCVQCLGLSLLGGSVNVVRILEIYMECTVLIQSIHWSRVTGGLKSTKFWGVTGHRAHQRNHQVRAKLG